LNTTCLGSLYIQDFNGAMTLCEMRIVEHTETVLQMQDNWYLVYSPIPFTGYVICLNNSNSEVFIKTGPNRIFVSPSCRMRLKASRSHFRLLAPPRFRHQTLRMGFGRDCFLAGRTCPLRTLVKNLGNRKCWPLHSSFYPSRNRS